MVLSYYTELIYIHVPLYLDCIVTTSKLTMIYVKIAFGTFIVSVTLSVDI